MHEERLESRGVHCPYCDTPFSGELASLELGRDDDVL